MNARNRTIVRVSLALASLAVCAVFATFTTSCASSDNNGGSGGSSAAAGTPAAGTAGGGSPATGGSPAAGGNAVTFSSGAAVGLMSGYGWIAMGTDGDAATSPTCGTTAPYTNISAAAPCTTQTQWDSTSALCITGTIAALSATTPDYSGNWGLEVGANANSDGTSPIGKSFSTISVAVSGTPTAGLRVDIGTTTSSSTAPYCASWTAGPIQLTSFNTECWNGASCASSTDGKCVQLQASDVPNITKVMIQVPSTTSAITVNELCMTGITFN
jgi:hypothetical protein